MKHFLNIVKSRWLPGNKEMIHEDKSGKQYIGPPITHSQGETVIVEASDGLLEDGYYHIVKVVGKY